MKNSGEINEVAIYQAKSGAIELRQDFDLETVWAAQADIAKLYDKDQSVISRHIKGIFKDGEVDRKSNMQKMHIANSDKPVEMRVIFLPDCLLRLTANALKRARRFFNEEKNKYIWRIRILTILLHRAIASLPRRSLPVFYFVSPTEYPRTTNANIL